MPGRLNQGADMLSRSNVPSEKWMFHLQVVQEIWGDIWQGRGHPFHLKRQLSLPDLLFEEHRRVGPRLVQPPPLRFTPALIPQVIR